MARRAPSRPARAARPTDAASSPPRGPSGRGRTYEAAADRWQQILAAATEAIYENGFAATSIQDIADRVGLLKGSLYYYVKSKDDILNAIVGEFFASWQASMATEEDGEDWLASLRSLIERDVIISGSNPEEMVVFRRELTSVRPQLRDAIVTARNAHRAQIEHLVRTGQEAGQVREVVDPKLMSVAILAWTDVHEWFRPAGRWSIDHLARQYADAILRSLLTEPAARAAGVAG